MAVAFLQKWFTPVQPLPAEAEEAITELTKLSEQHPHRADLASQLKEIIAAIHAEPIQQYALCMDSEQARAKLADGVPLLRGEKIDLDEEIFVRRWQRIAEVLQRHQPEAIPLEEALGPSKIEPRRFVDAVLAGQTEAIYEQMGSLGLDVSLANTVLWLSLMPQLCRHRAGLASLLQGVSWQHGFCPICGSWPKLGEYRGLEQTRFLRCGLCAAEWEFPRLCCPFCGCKDHRKLGYLHVEGEQGKYRATTCDECHQYVKMVSSLIALKPLQILVTDLATMHLDLIAADRGYFQPL